MSVATTAGVSLFEGTNFNPDAYGVLSNIDYGGMNLPEIMEELNDNSNDAGATTIDIYLLPNTETKLINHINVLDNGRGMTPMILFTACRMAAQTSHGEEDIGKFGMGLKNATMALGNLITIFTKTKGTDPIAIVMDVDAMKNEASFRPSYFTEKAEELSWSLPKELWRTFSSYTSGTLIHIRNLKDTFVLNVNDVMKDLYRTLNLVYSQPYRGTTNIHNGPSPNKQSLKIVPVDIFYRNNPQALTYCAETTLRVYKHDGGLYIQEVLFSKRYVGLSSTNEPLWAYGTETEPKSYRLWIERTKISTGKDKLRYRHVENELISDTYKEIKVRFISLSQHAFNEEGLRGQFTNSEQNRGGMYMYRGRRLVGSCLTLGESLDDESIYQRMEVVFPPSLDIEMGVRTQKQMTNHLNSQIISDALRILWNQQNSVCANKLNMNAMPALAPALAPPAPMPAPPQPVQETLTDQIARSTPVDLRTPQGITTAQDESLARALLARGQQLIPTSDTTERARSRHLRHPSQVDSSVTAITPSVPEPVVVRPNITFTQKLIK